MELIHAITFKSYSCIFFSIAIDIQNCVTMFVHYTIVVADFEGVNLGFRLCSVAVVRFICFGRYVFCVIS